MKRVITVLFSLAFIFAIHKNVQAKVIIDGNTYKTSITTNEIIEAILKPAAKAPAVILSKVVLSITEPKFIKTNNRDVFAIPVTYSAAKSLISSTAEIKPIYTTSKVASNNNLIININNSTTKLNYSKAYLYSNGGINIKKGTGNLVQVTCNQPFDKSIEIYTVKAKTIYSNGKYNFKTFLVISANDIKSGDSDSISPDNNTTNTIDPNTDNIINPSTPSPTTVPGNIIEPIQTPIPSIAPTASPSEGNITEDNLYKKLIVIDSGHGGKDSGACGNSLKEKDLNISIAYKVKDALEAKGYDVYLTRDSDYYVDLYERAEVANILKADLFLSIHNNSNGNKNYKGTTVLYNSKAKKPAQDLAEMMRDQISDSIGTAKLRLEDRPNLVVLNSTYMPAVLAEVAVLSNTSDAALLKKDDTLTLSAEAIMNSIDAYLNY